MLNWETALENHKNAMVAAGFKEENILGIFAYGSQNYNFATENSDWDTKAIIVPSFEDLVLKRPVTKEVKVEETDEHCEVKDIREMVEMFKKQNINFIEILFTEYKWVNPIYKDIWEKYFEANRERIAYYDMNKTLESICGQSLRTIRQNPTNGKQIANAYRLFVFLYQYLKEKPYLECITLDGKMKEFLLDLKNSTEEVNPIHADLLEKLFNDMKYSRQGFDLKNKLINTIVEEVMNNGIFELIKLNLPKEDN